MGAGDSGSENMAVRKKGIFFTATAIVLSIVIILSFKVYYGDRARDHNSAVSTRILTMNNFVKDAEQDLKNGIYIAGFRSFLSMQEKIADTGEYIPDVGSAFGELFLNGTIDGQGMGLMQDSTFTEWADRISIEAAKTGIKTSFKVNDIGISQSSPWRINIDVNINFTAEDIKGTSRWEKEQTLVQSIPIIGFEDPLYVINSLGRITNAIEITNLTPFVQGGDVGNLVMHMNGSLYIESASAPSYLMRLEGNLGNSSQGIESLANLQNFIAQGLGIEARSAVDYIYFGEQITNNHRINNTPYWFYIDEGHLEFYGAQNVTI